MDLSDDIPEDIPEEIISVESVGEDGDRTEPALSSLSLSSLPGNNTFRSINSDHHETTEHSYTPDFEDPTQTTQKPYTSVWEDPSETDQHHRYTSDWEDVTESLGNLDKNDTSVGTTYESALKSLTELSLDQEIVGRDKEMRAVYGRMVSKLRDREDPVKIEREARRAARVNRPSAIELDLRLKSSDNVCKVLLEKLEKAKNNNTSELEVKWKTSLRLDEKKKEELGSSIPFAHVNRVRIKTILRDISEPKMDILEDLRTHTSIRHIKSRNMRAFVNRKVDLVRRREDELYVKNLKTKLEAQGLDFELMQYDHVRMIGEMLEDGGKLSDEPEKVWNLLLRPIEGMETS
ncbi:hypothetical protein HDV05_001822 [Chytridiales sp. JEL 0842]|nr:hypothetical protein HDV05_001822 [Chytridiales sp. JEL 0842]